MTHGRTQEAPRHNDFYTTLSYGGQSPAPRGELHHGSMMIEPLSSSRFLFTLQMLPGVA